MSKPPIAEMPGAKVGGVAIAVWPRLVARADAGSRVAAQRHDRGHARIAVLADDAVDLLAAGVDAGQVPGDVEPRVGDDLRNGSHGALARGAARAIGDGDELRAQRREALDRFPQHLLHRIGGRREEFE